MTRITVACLDMAGTTVADDGTVLEAFAAAVGDLPADAFERAMTAVRSSMGQSKIEVFRRILGDEAAARKANEAFEDHYAAAVRRGAISAVPGAEDTIMRLRDTGVRVCLATGGPGIVYGRSTNSTINTGSANGRSYMDGAIYANAEFIQVHPTAIPGEDKHRLMSESARGDQRKGFVHDAEQVGAVAAARQRE